MRQFGQTRLRAGGGAPGGFAPGPEFRRIDAANPDEDRHAMLRPRPGFDEERVAVDDGEKFGLDRPLDLRAEIPALCGD